MINRTNTEYDVIKILREIQLMRKLNDLSTGIFQSSCKELNKEKFIKAFKKNPHSPRTTVTKGKGIFIPELIDIICPQSSQGVPTQPSSAGGSGHSPTSPKRSISRDTSDKCMDLNINYNQDAAFNNLNEICIVMELMEHDLDQVLK